MCFAAGPSASPSGVTADGMSTSISVQWGPVEPCADQNGPITGYSVRYGEMGSGSTQDKTATANEAVISGLETSTNYTVEVAAENSVGRGDYSEPIIVTTDSKISSRIPSVHYTHSLSCPFSCDISYSCFCYANLHTHKMECC